MAIRVRRLKGREWPILVIAALYALLWSGGIFSHLAYGGPPCGAAWASPAFLFTAAALVALAGWRDWRALIAALVVGFGAEVLGVLTAIPFGPYAYTPVLGPGLFGVPFAVSCAWLVLIAFVRQMDVPLRLAAVWMAAIDLIIEPLAANRLGYWHWLGRSVWYGAPYTNFVGWYLVSVVILYLAGKPAPRNPVVFAAGLSVQLFFTALSLIYALYAAAAVGVALCALAIARWIMRVPDEPVRLGLA